ncbi:hypothetical protein R3P38DRAFT_3329591 [Favolaschia claudopus]|uniref:DUF6589 domain-containing protein n=1 Tax=Favolaschia claudopus TaxID=2862362 RepID=A0AAV9ZYC0_9AGAR
MANPPSWPRRNRNYQAILDPNPIIPGPPPNAELYRPSSAPPLGPTLQLLPRQPRLRAPKVSKEEKMRRKFEAMDKLLREYEFATVGEFLSILFYNPARGEPDPRGSKHSRVVARFLRGRTKIGMADILPLIYSHKASFPAAKSADSHEQNMMFSTADSPDKINHARPFLSTWATRLVAFEGRKQIGRATRDNPADPERHAQLRAHTNGRNTKAHVVTWKELLSNFKLSSLAAQYSVRLPLVWFCTEIWTAPMNSGVVAIRKRRPHPFIQVGAIASFILARNRYANGDLAIQLGVWLHATKSHIDVKRVFSRFAYSVSDKTAYNALNTMSDGDRVELREDIQSGTERRERKHALIVDNTQAYASVYEQGIGRQSELKVGTAATCVELDDCAPGAFDAAPYYERVAAKERKTLTTDALYDDINWTHIRFAIPLQWTRVLVEFEPTLQHLSAEIAAMFREGPCALHRMREGRKTVCHPLGTNSEKSTETQGMERAIRDFDMQMGIDSDNPGDQLFWLRGDGASYANFLNLTEYGAPLGIFKNKIATPEIWHTGATELNSTAANHYGSATSTDPSSLSKCSGVAGLKRPSNMKSFDYYPTVRNLTLIWKAHVLDCWRLYFEADEIHGYFKDLATREEIPSLTALLGGAMILVDRYATQSAIQTSLSARESLDPTRSNKVPSGSSWPSDNGNIVNPAAASTPAEQQKDAPKAHEEKEGFTGDRVLRNSQIFMQDLGWWVEFAQAVPEGDIGRVWEIMKIWIFKFAGSSHQNYVKYLLEVYCLLRYEASKGLRDTILNNWLLNIKGELGRWLPGDQHQEHYNRWLEDMVPRHGGEFDDPFYRKTISPNVHHFLQIKEEVEAAFDLKKRSQTHTSPDIHDELTLLLRLFKEEEVHMFRSGRSMGHAAVNQFARGMRRLDAGKLDKFLKKSTAHGDFLRELRKPPHVDTDNEDGDEDDEVEVERSPAEGYEDEEDGEDEPDSGEEESDAENS